MTKGRKRNSVSGSKRNSVTGSVSLNLEPEVEEHIVFTSYLANSVLSGRQNLTEAILLREERRENDIYV